MKDYEYYNNKGNPEIKENLDLLKIEYFDLRSNDLPGENMDSFENSLACGLGSKSKSFTAKSQGKTLDDIQELSNALTPTTGGSIVESAGAAITGTATVVIGGAAAVIAFNGVPKDLPKMKINTLESGSSYVHYDLEASNLDLDKDYDIIISNAYQTIKLDCREGKNEEWVYDLRPGLQYSLTLVGYTELLGTVEYASENFYTLKSNDIFARGEVNVIYNDDFTCGIEYSTTLVDDKDNAGTTYIVVRRGALDDREEEEEWIVFNSLYLPEFDSDELDYTYSFENKVHNGSLKVVPEGMIYVELYRMVGEEESEDDILIDSIKTPVIYPLNEYTGANYINFAGDYSVIKEAKDIDIKKDNLQMKLKLYNENDEETLINKDIDITSSSFELRMLVKKDTVAYSYQVGYLNDDNEFIVVKDAPKMEFYGGYFDGYYYPVSPYDEEYINVEWKHGDDGTELADITLLTNFSNYGNDDAYYKVELLKLDDSAEELSYIVVDTYEGRDNAVFKDVEIGEIEQEEGDYRAVYEYTFRYYSYMNYYDSENGKEKVIMETHEPNLENGVVNLSARVMVGDGDFSMLSDGKFAINIYSRMDGMDDDFNVVQDGVKLKMYFYSNYSDDVDKVVELDSSKVSVATISDLEYCFVIDEKLPTGMIGYYLEYELPYIERYGGNVRTLKSNGKKLMGDISYKLAPTEIYRFIHDDLSSIYISFNTYMPDDYEVHAYYGGEDEVLTKDGNLYVFSPIEFNASDYSTIRFDICDSNGNQRTNYQYVLDVKGTDKLYNLNISDFESSSFVQDCVIYTFDNESAVTEYVNINLLTNFINYNPDEYEITVDYSLYRLDENEGAYILVAYKNGVTDTIINFNFADRTQSVMEYIDTFFISYTIHMKYKNIPFGMCQDEIDMQEVSSIAFTGSNYTSITDQSPLQANLVSDGGEYYVSLTIPTNAVIDENETITFRGNYNGDDLSDYTVKFSGAVSKIETADGTTYLFEIPDSYEDIILNSVGSVYMDVPYNYTLTPGKMEQLGNTYSGKLYRIETLYVSMA